MNICLFDQNELNSGLSETDPRGQHILKILHKNTGDTFSAGITGGMAGTAKITAITGTEGQRNIQFEFIPQSDGKPLYPLTMIIGFPRPIQLKRLFRDMAGLGVSQIHLCGTELGEKSYLKSDLADPEKCRQLLQEGSVQAASTHIPQIFIHNNLEECVNFVLNNYDGPKDNLFTLDNIAPETSLYNRLNNAGDLSAAVAAIGNERGWTDNERMLLKNKSFIPLSMGPRVLRTETASTVAASLILSAMGKL